MDNETLDLRSATKIEVGANTFCSNREDCPMMKIFNKVVGTSNYEAAVEVIKGTPETKIVDQDGDNTYAECLVMLDNGRDCPGVISITRSLLERRPSLRYTARTIITEQNTIGDNPEFGKLN